MVETMAGEMVDEMVDQTVASMGEWTADTLVVWEVDQLVDKLVGVMADLSVDDLVVYWVVRKAVHLVVWLELTMAAYSELSKVAKLVNH